ncbi:MAG: bifunctional aconitate hydratase 2/2-methylisocitrate dehydratase [Pseudanabaenaceae cyanobacterium bins.68]|nr:bifunctional aconitate hydratase 2/2-methylisocitrate dehydratase [Pseudanabaenaceae cyanobacterium bins.68]
MFLTSYRDRADQRQQLGIPPLALDAQETKELCELLQQPTLGEEDFLLDLVWNRVPPGVDQAAYVKATFLTAIAHQKLESPLISPEIAVEMLGTMAGGYNVTALIELLNSERLGSLAADALSHTLLVFDSFHQVWQLAQGNPHAQRVIQAWAEATWFTRRSPLAETMTGIVFKVSGEINTDDLSPAAQAFSRPDIPLHALSMLESRSPGAIATIAELKAQGYPVFFVGDVIGTGSSRKSAINSLLWHIGTDIPHIPNKRAGGVIIGRAIAPIFFNTAEDAGCLPIQTDVSELATGMVINIHPYAGQISDQAGKVIASFQLQPDTITDEIRAGGRIPLIIGRSLTDKTRQALGLAPSPLFIRPTIPADQTRGYTLAQKMVGQACGLPGVRPGTACEPIVTTVGSQDTTGPMTRDELKELACLGFSADLVLQSFCHTAAYPKPTDIKTHHELPDFFANRGGIALKVGDGIIHSWLNRMLLPDTVGTGGDSHTRFPLGISFPAGSGLVAFAAALGVMPLNMPESVLVRFRGELQPGVTLRDIVNAIPYVAIQQGALTVEKQNKKNIFSGRIMEIEGLPDLKVEQAFELTDATAERSCAGCTIKLSEETIAEYLRSNVALLRHLIAQGYQDAQSIQRRIDKMEAWLANPVLLSADPDAEYAHVLEIDLNQITEPIVAAPNDPDNVKLLSEVAGDRIDEVFIGSCMTNIGHYRAAAKVLEQEPPARVRLWICPPTRMDEHQLKEEGMYSIFGLAGARTEVPGCSLCMGNQARVGDGTTVFSTSTRNFNNRMGKDARVYLGSAELAAVCALLGKVPTVSEYQAIVANKLNPFAADLYRYLNFDQIPEFAQV